MVMQNVQYRPPQGFSYNLYCHTYKIIYKNNKQTIGYRDLKLIEYLKNLLIIVFKSLNNITK